MTMASVDPVTAPSEYQRLMLSLVGLRDNDDDPRDLLALFEPLRLANLALWRRTPGPARQRVGLHSERGRESLDLMFRMIAGHDRFHLAQMDRTLRAIRVGAGSA